MPIDIQKQIFNKPSGSTQKWDSIEGQHLIEVHDVQRRGINEGINVLGEIGANIKNVLGHWAKLDFFFVGELQASLQVQLQTPLNLFDEIGLATRLHAIAKAAIAVGIEIDLTVGQIVNRVTQRSEVKGLPEKIFRIIMEEIELEGVVYGQLAVAIMAYADLVAVFDLFDTEKFEFVFDAGYGFIVGGGYRCYVRANLHSPKRMFQRVLDPFIFETLREVKKLGLTNDQTLQLEFLFRVVFRFSYDLGKNFQQFSNSSDADTDNQNIIINIFIEEGQWWFLRRISQFGGNSIRNQLNRIRLISEDVKPLLQLIETLPTEGTELWAYIQKWVQIIDKITPLIPVNEKSNWVQNISIMWASLSLLFPMSQRFVTGNNLYIDDPNDPVNTPIPGQVRSWINIQLQRSESNELTILDLRTYLVDTPLSLLLDREPLVQNFLNIFHTLFSTFNNIAMGLLHYKQGSISPSVSDIQSIQSGLLSIVQTQLTNNLRNRIKHQLPLQSEVLILIENSLFPLIDMVSKEVLSSVINGSYHVEDRRMILLEGISSAILPLLGRPMILLSEAILTDVQELIPRKLNELADQLEKIPELASKFSIRSRRFSFLLRPLQVALRSVSRILNQPLVSREVYSDFKQIFTPIQGTKNAEQYLIRLGEDILRCPQQSAIDNLLKHLAESTLNRMVAFSGRIIEELIKAHIAFLIDTVNDIFQGIQEGVNKMREDLLEKMSNLLSQPLVELFLGPAKAKLRRFGFSQEVLSRFEDSLTGAIFGLLEASVLLPIKLALASWKLDANILLQSLSEQNVAQFSRLTIDSLSKHLLSRIQKQLGFSLKLSVKNPFFPFFGDEKITANLGRISLPINRIIPVIVQSLAKFPFDDYPIQEIGNRIGGLENVTFLLESRKKIKNLITNTFRIIEEYSNRSRLISSYSSSISRPAVVLRLPAIVPQTLEVIIHNYDKKLNKYQRFKYDSNVSIFINDNAIPLNTFVNIVNNKIRDRSAGLLRQRMFGEEELKKGINTLLVVSTDDSGKKHRTHCSFQM
ncbi:hypothetical protein [Paenibacillus anseongense]|uniref:hypothetical protein n=1 Tax=Paenibacillus anseongense TaxID=2682845 RepID=UPI002DBD5B66|nr:hypothetical protein [Paenibacillus anseongense]MEC0269074.1 hypothetical protein [Paenibacillus anseongense]